MKDIVTTFKGPTNNRSARVIAKDSDNKRAIYRVGKDSQDNVHGIAAKYQVTIAAAAGVISALSPGRDWSSNVQDAETFVSEFANGARGRWLPRVGSYGGKNLRKAEKILSGKDPLAILGGLKVRA